MKEKIMKPRRPHKNTGPDWQGKRANLCKKTTVSQDKQTSLVSSTSHVRPFAGKVFYLDLQSNRTAEALERDIKDLGGTVEKFFSKEIRYLVSNKQEAKFVHCLRHDSPLPSPDSSHSSPRSPSKPHRPVSHGDKDKHRSQDQADRSVKSRGKSLVEKVMKGQGRVQMDRILSNALEWGVKILHVDDVLAYVRKKKQHIHSKVSSTPAVRKTVKTESSAKPDTQKLKGGRICKPFIKVEDSSRHYRPIYLTMSKMPEFNLKTAAPCSPFCLEDKDPPGTKQLGHRVIKVSASEEKAQGQKKNRDKKRSGYCECCRIKYNNLRMHLQSERHKTFSKSDEYSVVDRLVSALYFRFIPVQTKVKKPRCSVSSVLLVPGPCEETDRGAHDHSEAVKVEEQSTVDASQGLYSRQSVKNESSPGSAQQIHSKRDRWNCYTYSKRSEHKSTVKRTSRQKSLSSCSQNVEKVHIPELNSETLPSRGECQPSFPPKDAQAKLVEQIPPKDTNVSTLYSQSINTGSEVSAKGDIVEMNQDEAFHKSETEMNLSGMEETSRGTPDLSSVRKIQRRVRFYKHKRRKFNINSERAESSDAAENSLLKLWNLFQSSEDTDVEFRGFEEQN